VILFDSNLIIYLSKELISTDDLIDNEVYAISVITYMEVLGYTFVSEKEETFVKELIQLFEIIYIDKEIVKQVIEIRKLYKIKLPDAIICATALTKKLALYTNDIRLNVIKELDVKSL
jgi:predicted nucleic acid-binding protein